MKIAFVYMNNECNVGRGAGYVAAAVMRAGHDLRFFDNYLFPLSEIAGEIENDPPDMVMISSMTMLFPEALKLIRLVKKKRPVMPVIVGGIHSTIMGKRLLEVHGEIDYLCVGEGESMVVDFVEKFGSDELYEVENLAYRREGRVFQNPIRPAEDLSSIPPFPWHFFSPKAVVQEGTGFLYVDATRGCPYRCTYCCNSIYLSHYGKNYLRYRPVEDVLEELTCLKETYHPQLFYFGDEMILSDSEYAGKLFQSFKSRLDTPYGCMARVEHINQGVVDFFADTGCRYIAMGIECGNEEFRRKHLNRYMSNDQIERAFALVKSKGIFATSFNMIGYPFDNDSVLTEDTVKLNQKIQPDFAQISIFYPFPGTELYQRCIDLDLIDRKKILGTGNYFSESVLKGVRLGDKKNELHWLLNPNDFQFTRDGEGKKDTPSISIRLKRAAFTSTGAARWFLKIVLFAATRAKRLVK